MRIIIQELWALFYECIWTFVVSSLKTLVILELMKSESASASAVYGEYVMSQIIVRCTWLEINVYNIFPYINLNNFTNTFEIHFSPSIITPKNCSLSKLLSHNLVLCSCVFMLARWKPIKWYLIALMVSLLAINHVYRFSNSVLSWSTCIMYSYDFP